MRGAGAVLAFAAALAIGAGWPRFAAHWARAAEPAPAPLQTDYLHRNQYVAFYEAQLRADPEDQITARVLGSQYLQRFREAGDLNDVARALAVAKRSLRLQRQGNVAALSVIASCELTFHRFKAALATERDAADAAPFDDDARAQSASILMELGRYAEAASILARPQQRDPNPTWMSIRARYEELTGNLRGARVAMSAAAEIVDGMISVPAYTRSWYHMRAGQLAFEAGDSAAAAAAFDEALRIYPDNSMALLLAAKLYRAQRDWPSALASARRSAELYPLPQALGYQADAQRALGDGQGARRTDALIRAEQRLFNAQGINDRLLATYYAEHNEHLNDALVAARSDLDKRGDEVYADDTMAWVLAAMERWTRA
ncbi:MAG TPA: tetratricopeptide repeat protein, partial [Candidatus Cybelea sp.]|nr:tetratricopeptide repeat protein [Candidatus Cybelea sp.]